MARKVLFAKQTVSGFHSNTNYGGLYTKGFNFPESGHTSSPIDSFTLEVGKTYIVDWDGVEYEVVGQDASALGSEVALGNGSAFGLSGNNEPFGITCTNGSGVTFVSLTETVDSHIVGIYQEVADEEPEEPEEEEHIVLKDRNGNDILFQGINMIKLPTTSGGTKTFAACDDVEKTVVPDFSDGDFVVLPDTGTLLSKVTVEKPEALSPENIRKGKEIAGVTGDFIGDTEEVTVELALADGDQTVSPSAVGKVISGVTIKKPETLTPANIAKGVEVAGVVGSLAAETEEATVELDFSNGDMAVTPTGEKAFSKVNIPVPGTLIPENIAEGVDIAGIVGTLVAGGGSEVKIEIGKFGPNLSTAKGYKLYHSLGVVPDILILIQDTGYTSTAYNTQMYFGTSRAFFNRYGGISCVGVATRNDRSSALYMSKYSDEKYCLDYIDSTNVYKYSATSTYLTLGSTWYPLCLMANYTASYYNYVLIAGLS